MGGGAAISIQLMGADIEIEADPVEGLALRHPVDVADEAVTADFNRESVIGLLQELLQALEAACF